ncbi:MAG: enoyl-CoA hydratase/isomerase family protein [bacterium]
MAGMLRWRHERGVAVLALNRPDRLNSLCLELLDAIEARLMAAEAADDVHAILIVAEGPHFCAGADLGEVSARRKDRDRLAEFIARGHEVLLRLEACPLPVVAAVQGYCLAGGLELMMAVDVVLAAEDARIGCQHARYGLVPGWGGTQRLARLVGLRRALELMYSARWLEVDEARSWGLVNDVVPATVLDERALELASELSGRSRTGLAAMKRLAREGLDLPLQDALALERERVVDVLLGDDAAEGLAAFRERREPRFN